MYSRVEILHIFLTVHFLKKIVHVQFSNVRIVRH
jgi:hypothetical protein